MRKNIQKVIAAFRDGKAAREATCSTDGTIVYSYRLPVARRVASRGRERIEILANHPTMTTRSQISALRYSFPDAEIVHEDFGFTASER